MSSPSNSRVSLPALALFALLLAESLTTFNYLSAYTTYIQLLLMLGRMPKARAFGDYFPISHLLLVVLCHVIQLAQWLLTLASTLFATLLVDALAADAAPLPVELAASYANPAYDHPSNGPLLLPHPGLFFTGLRPLLGHNGTQLKRSAQPGEEAPSLENRRNEEAEARAQLCPQPQAR